jgi:oligoribonuclease
VKIFLSHWSKHPGIIPALQMRLSKMSDNSKKGADFYIWFDTEYSDLDLERAQLLQVSALITDTSLRRVVPQVNDVILPVRLPMGEKPSPWVEQYLPDLVIACRSELAVDLAEADNQLAAYVDAVVGAPAANERERPFLAGNSIHADWWLVHHFLPRFRSRLHYRHLDVTSFKLEWQRIHPDIEFEKENSDIVRKYFPEAVLPAAGTRHDAYYDLQASIAELAFYRRHFLRRENIEPR